MMTASLSFEDATIPAALKALPQWVCWRAVPNGDRIEKIPVRASTGDHASSTEPRTWTDYSTAAMAASTHDELGIGFVFCRDAGIVGVDLDKCRDRESGQLDPWAEEIVNQLNTYTEVSPSGTGLHLFMWGTLPPGKRKKGHIETYEQGRFFTVTGQHLDGSPLTIEARPAELAAFHTRYLADRPVDTSPRSLNGHLPPVLSDDEILTKCRTAKNAAKFETLWRGDVTGYPSHSEADLALMSVLSFYTQEECQLDGLHRRSGLHREKWDERHGERTYGALTIAKALAHIRETYTPRPEETTVMTTAIEDAATDTAHANPWPILDEVALYGLPGELLKSVEPYSEADPVGILLHILLGAGALIGPQPHVLVEHSPHYARTNGLLVGMTAGGRKGTAWGTPRYVFSKIDETFVLRRVKSGLSSGEGLIYQVRDPQYEQEPIREGGRRTGEILGYRDRLTDPGESDKRLLIIESEFSSALKVMEREGNTLSPVLRDAWDHGNLSPLTKKDRMAATGAHVGIIGHITQHELLRELTATDRANGFANRFLCALVRQSKFLPSGKGVPQAVLSPYFLRFSRTLEKARTRGELTRDKETEDLWASVYRELAEVPQGLTGAILARGAAQVLRLSLIYCLLDEAEVMRTETAIRVPHLLAALAIWDYCRASAYQIFGDAVGDPVADRLLRLIKAGPKTDTDLYESMGKHEGDRNRKGHALDLLQRLDRVHRAKIGTAGRTITEWHVGNLHGCAICAKRG